MCGIAGICSVAQPIRHSDRLAPMVAAIVHRGPDSNGTFVDEHAALGATRLAIIDLLGGDQPLHNEDGSLTLVCNGEIYNYRELRRRLVAGGHRFSSETDIEVILHLYEERGIELVHELNGMFAFALWDARRGALHLARDRFGVKPLHYRWDGGELSFGSEIKSLLAAGTVEPRLDGDALVELLTFQNVVSDRSLFAGVSQLPAGSRLRLDREGLAIERYYDPLPRSGKAPGDAAAQVRERFERAVELQLVSDVELASYLSGGLDTGAIVAAAAPRLDRLTTFSAGFDTRGAEGAEAEFDERAEAARLALGLGTHHHELLLDGEDMEMVLGRMIWHLEEPRMSFSYPNYLVAGMTSRWVKAVLSGMGGDELFGGYPWRYALADGDFPGDYYRYWPGRLGDPDLAALLEPGLLAGLDLDQPRSAFDELLAPAGDLEPIDQILYFESKTFLAGLLVLEDKLSMAHGLETRVPFLENELVDLVLGLPAAVKLGGGRSKHLLRTALEGLLPAEVVNRKKTGFTPPQAAWFRGRQAPYIKDLLLSERARERGVFRPDEVGRIITEHCEGRRDWRLLIWTMLGIEWWQRVFVDGERPG